MERTVQRARHPSLFLLDFMKSRGLNQKELAQLIGKSPTEINAIIKKIKDINVDFAIRFSIVFGTSPELRLNMQHNYDVFVLEEKKKDEYSDVKDKVSVFSFA